MNDQAQDQAQDQAESTAKIARSMTGRVISDKMDKTLVVLIEHKVKHPLYGKYVRRSTKYHVHDESNQGKIGDTVSFKECRPISKKKHWALLDVVGKVS